MTLEDIDALADELNHLRDGQELLNLARQAMVIRAEWERQGRLPYIDRSLHDLAEACSMAFNEDAKPVDAAGLGD